MSKPDDIDKFLERTAKPACPICKGTGKIELEKNLDIVFIQCKTCSGYGYLLAKGHYITFEQFQEMLNKEPKPMYKLLLKVIWYLGLKSGEAIKIKPKDINIPNDVAKLQKYGGNSEVNSIRVWRTLTRARYLPLPSWLKDEIMEYIKSKNILDDAPIFDRDRTTVFQRLSAYGNALGGKKKIGSDAMRKGFGIWYLAEGGRLEDLQQIYGHNNISQTKEYLAIDGRTALKNFMEFQKDHSPYTDQEDEVSEQYDRLKHKLMDTLGTDKCVKCGEKEYILLDFDHIEGGGNNDVKKFGSHTQMLRFYVDHPSIARKRLQVLCVKCNRRKKHENKEFGRFW